MGFFEYEQPHFCFVWDSDKFSFRKRSKIYFAQRPEDFAHGVRRKHFMLAKGLEAPTSYKKRKTPENGCLLVGSKGLEPLKSSDNRFTVCSIWPLWKLPITKGMEKIMDL